MWALHAPMPLTATSVGHDLVVVERVQAVELELARHDVLGKRAQGPVFACESPAATRISSGSAARTSSGDGGCPPKYSSSRR